MYLSPAVTASLCIDPVELVAGQGNKPPFVSDLGAVLWPQVEDAFAHAPDSAEKKNVVKRFAVAAHAVDLKRLSLDSISIAHSSQLRSVFALVATDPFLAFTIGVTILERGLYDLNWSSTGGARRNMILRDLIASHQLKESLGAAPVEVLQILFSPIGLNIRNLVWHGFLTPSDFPPAYASLIAVLIYSIFAGRRINPSDVSWDPNNFNENQCFAKDSHTITRAILESDGWIKVLNRTEFIPASHQSFIKSGIEYLDRGFELLFLVSVLPALEHSLRVLFAKLNNVPEISIAHTDAYFSTLDGFGQRNIHQTLLDSVVVSTGLQNHLLQVLNRSDLGNAGVVSGPQH
ncbi:hypothetical protein BC830DRAFT_736799 [Chytriomyces sp. MP71]|nr:hypothetical protein BC830DRAFT_736799 [Chytriomyces sp. MP71]